MRVLVIEDDITVAEFYRNLSSNITISNNPDDVFNEGYNLIITDYSVLTDEVKLSIIMRKIETLVIVTCYDKEADSVLSSIYPWINKIEVDDILSIVSAA